MNLTGLILAGGRGGRLHPHKFLLPLGGRRIIDRVLDAVRPACPRVIISANDSDAVADLGLPVVRDAETGHGPLGGIVAGLKAVQPGACLAVGADMPFISAELLAHLAGRASEADVIIPRHGGHYEALCCVYGPRCLEPAQELLRSGRNKIIDFFDRVSVSEVPESELAQFGRPEVMFFNVNTPADLAEGEELCRRLGL